MAYDPFTNAKPDGSVDTGPQVVDYARKNLMALRDAVVMGAMSGWNYSYTGTADKPTTVKWTRAATEIIRATLTYDANDNVTKADWEYSSNNGGAYTALLPYRYEHIAYDANYNVTSTTWDNTP